MMFSCPICRSQLLLSSNSYKCSGGHSFDISSKGYVNLLVSQKSGIHGDSKEMLAARRRFLCLGHYGPIISLLCDKIASCGKKTINILDAGCGEGYYTGGIYEGLRERGIDANIYGIDVSKDAVGMAAKRYKNCKFAVSSVNQLCFPDGCFDFVISLFAPISEAEFARVLSADGELITVSPAPKHLWGLKSIVYKDAYENEETTFVPQIFKLKSTDKYVGEMTLDTCEQVNDLFKMTPYYHKTDIEGKQRIERIDKLVTEIGFMFFAFGL